MQRHPRHVATTPECGFALFRPTGRRQAEYRPIYGLPIIGYILYYSGALPIPRSPMAKSALKSRPTLRPTSRPSGAAHAPTPSLPQPRFTAPPLAGAFEALARRICAMCAAGAAVRAGAAALLGAARRIAKAQIDLMRVRRQRHELIARTFVDPRPVTAQIRHPRLRCGAVRFGGILAKRTYRSCLRCGSTQDFVDGTIQ